MENKMRLIQLESHKGDTGDLVVIEGQKEIPFSIARVFYIYGVNSNAVRGKHANKDSEFVLICVQGTCKVMADDGFVKETFVLDQPYIGLYLNKMTWKEMYDFSVDSVLMVLASEKYNPTEYISDYDIFRNEVKKRSET